MKNLLFNSIVVYKNEQETWHAILTSTNNLLKTYPSNEDLKRWREDSIKHYNILQNLIDSAEVLIKNGTKITPLNWLEEEEEGENNNV